MSAFARVIVDVPVAQPLDYRIAPETVDEGCAEAGPAADGIKVQVGSLCVVPVGRRRHVGIVVGLADQSEVEASRLRAIAGAIAAPRLSSSWLELCRFAAEYYHYPWGEVALPALPPLLRTVPRAGTRKAAVAKRATRALEVALPDALELASVEGVTSETSKTSETSDPSDASVGKAPRTLAAGGPVRLRAEQEAAIREISAAQRFAPFLLFGVTGSGKTEVYLGAIAMALARPGHGQALLLVPEINLTPQLHARLCARFPERKVVSLHSGLSARDRAEAWMQAHDARAQIVLGTRTAVFASLPHLRLIIVDEEHDASFKAHGGVPYSARDLAVKRGQIESLPVVLGSATPSLETWHLAQTGRYRLLILARRGGPLDGGAAVEPLPPADPLIEMVDLRQAPPEQGLAAPVREALRASLERGEQALVFINRRGFAPVLRCGACEWLSRCPRCETYAAYHKVGAALRCHHCGWSRRVPASCPDCGNTDLEGVGQGTQRVEETLRGLWPQARIARIDRDNTRGTQGAARAGMAFDAVHSGEIDILVGTQMITKGHDFRRVGTVAVLNADAQLVAADFRAPERLFAVLMQVAGRAGRAGQPSRVLIQTRYPHHPLFVALARLSFSEFAQEQVAERRAARLPPFVHQALLTAAARTMERALGFLRRCAALKDQAGPTDRVTLYDAVPMPLPRLASESRGQLLIESAQRADLHAFLDLWLPLLRAQGSSGVLRWNVEVDPQAI